MRSLGSKTWPPFAGAAFAVMALLILGGSGWRQTSPDEQSAWQPLFNGRNLDGWTVKIAGLPLGEDPLRTFRVEHGLLRVSYDNYTGFDGEFGHLFFDRPFARYRLRLEYRFRGRQVDGGPDWATRNSGVMLHAQAPTTMSLDQPFPLSIEAQFLGGLGDGPRPTGNLCTPGTHVEIDGQLVTQHCTESSSDTFDGDAWIAVEIEVHGSERIIHRINGREVLRYQSPQVGGEEGPADYPSVAGTALGQGYIALQAESHPVDFRNIEIAELPDP